MVIWENGYVKFFVGVFDVCEFVLFVSGIGVKVIGKFNLFWIE